MALAHRTPSSARRTALAAVMLGVALSLAGCVGSAPGTGSLEVTNGPCSGRSFTVSEDGAQLALDGECGDVVIDADDVTINLDAATSLVIDGNDVTVIANRRVDTLTMNGEGNNVNGSEMGSVNLDGTRGTVIATLIETLAVSGDDNTVNWDSGAQGGSDTGSGNTLIYNGE
ncbi:MAG: DUF3060 domain-containing protein [Candidatus Microbacterium phytovorans]|uniref:DUF3060 domain-containing protein n=1 Tax=Candidatus Microbacterium phytovorans TaxID=3121374 RepID=A0AAJ6B3J6_9MICO|nr:DUF3060 domain-containing protein [Microbacterium sp.]WEK13114.1 MAG: DUF3060 domain-containing protein [Microbacterium sp.]